MNEEGAVRTKGTMIKYQTSSSCNSLVSGKGPVTNEPSRILRISKWLAYNAPKYRDFKVDSFPRPGGRLPDILV